MAPLVLVVDDNQDAAEILTLFLEKWGYRTATANRGVTGLAMAWVLRPDLVLLNVTMPGMSGPDVLKELRGDPATARLKVILTSAWPYVGQLAEEGGAEGAIRYPVNPKELQGRVERLLA